MPFSVKAPLSSTPSGKWREHHSPNPCSMCRCSAARLQEPLCIFPGNETAPVSVAANRMERPSTRAPAARKPGCLGLFAGWFCVCVILISCPIDAPCRAAWWTRILPRIEFGFSYLENNSITLLPPPPSSSPSPASFLSQSRSAVTSSDQVYHLHFFPR